MLAFHMFGYRQTRTAHPACPETRGTHSEARSTDSRSLPSSRRYLITSPHSFALCPGYSYEPLRAEPRRTLQPTPFPSITSHIFTHTLAPATPLQSSGYFTTLCTPRGGTPKKRTSGEVRTLDSGGVHKDSGAGACSSRAPEGPLPKPRRNSFVASSGHYFHDSSLAIRLASSPGSLLTLKTLHTCRYGTPRRS